MPCLKFLSITLGSKTNLAVTRCQDDSIFIILHPFFLTITITLPFRPFHILFIIFTWVSHRFVSDAWQITPYSLKHWQVRSCWARGIQGALPSAEWGREPQDLHQEVFGSCENRGKWKATWMWVHFGRDCQSIFGNAEMKIGRLDGLNGVKSKNFRALHIIPRKTFF